MNIAYIFTLLPQSLDLYTVCIKEYTYVLAN